MKYFTYFHVKSLKCDMYGTMHLWHNAIWTNHTWNTQQLHVASGYNIWQYSPRQICTRIYVQNVNYTFWTYLFLNALGLCCYAQAFSSCGRQILNHWTTREDPLSNQIRSVAQSCPTFCDPMNCSTPGLPVHHQLPEFTQTHVHRVSDAIQPSHPLSSPSLLAPNPSQHQSLFQWVNSSHEVAKVLEFQL